MKEITSERYEGLIARAAELAEVHEGSGWKLAEFIHDAVEELYSLGMNVLKARDQRPTAVGRVARDLGRSQSYVAALRSAWMKYGDPSKRMAGLTFNDHVHATRVRPALVGEIKKRRAKIRNAAATRADRPEGSRRRKTPAIDPLVPYRRFSTVKSELRRIIDSNVWDYEDREKALALAGEIEQLAQELVVKFGGQKDAKPARRRAKIAA